MWLDFAWMFLIQILVVMLALAAWVVFPRIIALLWRLFTQ